MCKNLNVKLRCQKVNRASFYNLVNRTNLVHNFLNMFIAFLCMFRPTMCSSSPEDTAPMRHPVFVTIWMTVWYAGWNEFRSAYQSDEYQVSHRYVIFSWWWAHSCPKHSEKSNKHIKENLCANLVLFTRLQEMFVTHSWNTAYEDSLRTSPESKEWSTQLRNASIPNCTW
jgi:hypothetical protein